MFRLFNQVEKQVAKQFLSTIKNSTKFDLKIEKSLPNEHIPELSISHDNVELLKKYRDKLLDSGTPAIITKDKSGKPVLKVWDNQASFLKRIDKIGEQTLQKYTEKIEPKTIK